MLLSTGALRALRYSFVVFFFCSCFPSAFASGTDMLELWFEYDGRPVKLESVPDIQCVRQQDGQPVACSLYRSDDGRYWISRPANGRYLLRISVDENGANPPLYPGDLYREYPFTVSSSTRGPLLISLHRLMALQQPMGNGEASPGQADACDNRPHFSADILSLFPTAAMEFAWRPLAPDSRYHYTLWRVRCSDGMRLEQVFYRQTSQQHVRETIAPNKSGEYYQFELTAVSDNQTIGELLLHDGNGGRAGEFRFVVHDPLIDRIWLYYALGALALLFSGWVVIGALRSQPGEHKEAQDDTRAPRSLRPAIWLLLLSGSGVAGYLQREQLMPWLEQGSEMIAQWEEAGESWFTGQEPAAPKASAAGSPPPKHTTSRVQEWRGVVVSTNRAPFVGSERRAEIRLRFLQRGAEVAFNEAGKWVNATGGTFRRQTSGSGMTLFGHRRDKSTSELWSISIPDTKGTVWQLSLDRMVTRRTADGRVLGSERLQASGEVHTAAP